VLTATTNLRQFGFASNSNGQASSLCPLFKNAPLYTGSVIYIPKNRKVVDRVGRIYPLQKNPVKNSQ
jgi:hypothetical protein